MVRAHPASEDEVAGSNPAEPSRVVWTRCASCQRRQAAQTVALQALRLLYMANVIAVVLPQIAGCTA